jgi:NAD(P)-dependent dehydrogenase (short-subunit alcohol dehydrogenase family)
MARELVDCSRLHGSIWLLPTIAHRSVKRRDFAVSCCRAGYAAGAPGGMFGQSRIGRQFMDVLELRLAGKVAIVTGGSEGLGRACVERFAKSGAKVAVCSRRKDVLERAVDEIQKKVGGDILAMAADVTNNAEVEAFVAATVARFGGVDILVNNAGTSSAAAFEQVDDAAWMYDFDSKVMGAIRFCRLVIPHMKRRGGGRIINVTTVGGKAPAARSLPTSMSRAAGINLTKSLAHEYAPDRILVNTICLGLVKSAQHERRAKGDLDAYYRDIAEKRRLPLGRFGEAHEFADLVAFLASERAAYITGTAINFDGGITAAV